MSTLAWWTPGPWEIAVIVIIALLLFGRKLPQVARNVGRSLVEFKRGLKSAKDEFDQAAREADEKDAEDKPRKTSEQDRPPGPPSASGPTP